MSLYLCGPVSLGGQCTPEQEAANIQRFHEVEAMLRHAGYMVESSAKILEFCDQTMVACMLPDDGVCPPEGVARWQWFMRRTTIQMLTCNGVATLERVNESRGCLTEMFIANNFGLPIKTYGEWLRAAAQVPLPDPMRADPVTPIKGDYDTMVKVAQRDS